MKTGHESQTAVLVCQGRALAETPASRLLVLYHCPSILLRFVGSFVRRLGEPLRSVFSAEQMRALLTRHGFTVVHDENLRAIGAAMSRPVRRGTRAINHMRIVTAPSARAAPVAW
ncbi:MAG TPA: hypothetical protein VFK02_35110 [Kofleriaceae bacterium]|nr:hypothetical protein [Kofleriaceae bacterium]